MSKIKSLRCPTCRKIVTAKDADFPFCSEHCKTVDLGKWASGVYRISSPYSILNYWKRLRGCGLARLAMSDPAPGKKTTWAWAVGTFLGAGLLRPGPGSWGSAAAALIWLAAAKNLHLASATLAWLTLAAALCAVAIGMPAATIVERESKRPDPGHVVIDEVAGQWITLIYSRVNLSHLLAGFLFFRLFDIVKPWPARRLESLPAGRESCSMMSLRACMLCS